MQMPAHDSDPEQRFREFWDAVRIARRVPYTLFTFGESELPYYLVVDAPQPRQPVRVSRGLVRVTRPRIVTLHDAPPELRNFFEDEDLAGTAVALMSRAAAFSNLKLENRNLQSELVSDSMEEIVQRLAQRLDDEEEDRVAILTVPYQLEKMAVLRYTAERILESAPDNIQELRERGFLPESI